MFNPFAGAEFITRVIGIILFIYGILDIISTARIIKIVKKTTPTHKEKNKIEDNQKEENIVEAEVIEDNTKENKKKTKKATKDE